MVGENGAGKSTLMKVLSASTRTARRAATIRYRQGAAASPSTTASNVGIIIVHQELALVL